MIVTTKSFSRESRKSKVEDHDLRRSVADADQGLIEAVLGHCLIKQRLARKGQGKSRSFRAIAYYRKGHAAVFLHLFAKNDKGNLTEIELEVARELAKQLDSLTLDQMLALVERREWRLIEDVEPEEDLPK